MLLVKQSVNTVSVSQGAGVFSPLTLLRFHSRAPSFAQYIKTPPSIQLLTQTWQRSRAQAEQAAPSLLSAIQTFLKTHNKHRLRELALVLVEALKRWRFIPSVFVLALRSDHSNAAAIALQGSAVEHAPVSGTTHTAQRLLPNGIMQRHGRRHRRAGDAPLRTPRLCPVTSTPPAIAKELGAPVVLQLFKACLSFPELIL